MSTKYIERRHDAAKVATGSHAGVGVEYSTNKIYVKPAPDVDRVELVDTSTAQTLTNKTLEAPTITNPVGLLRTARVDFVEDATSVSHTATIPIPAGSVLASIRPISIVPWGAESANLLSSAGYTVGANWVESPDDVFTHTPGAVATVSHSLALVVGRTYRVRGGANVSAGSLTMTAGGSFSETATTEGPGGFGLGDFVATSTASPVWTPSSDFDGEFGPMEIVSVPALVVGDTANSLGFGTFAVDSTDGNGPYGERNLIIEGNGAYCAEGYLVGPTSGNFGPSYAAGSNLIATLSNPSPGGTSGRTLLVVEYSVPASFTPVLA